jgi:hypothetical protein
MIRTRFFILFPTIMDPMIATLIEKAKGFLQNPVESFQKSKADEPSAVFSYFGVLLLFNAILCAIVAMFVFQMIPGLARLPGGLPVPVIVFISMLFGGFIVTLVFSAWLHLWVYILGGRRGIMQTVSAIIYGSTPRLLFGWIPVISIIFVIWSFGLWILGVRELQELSTGKAVAAVVIAVIIPLIVIILIAAYLMVSVVSMTSVPTP